MMWYTKETPKAEVEPQPEYYMFILKSGADVTIWNPEYLMVSGDDVFIGTETGEYAFELEDVEYAEEGGVTDDAQPWSAAINFNG